MKNSPKLADIFYCKYCDYNCSKINDYNKHLLTLKHKNRTNRTNLEQINIQNTKNYICSKCNKSYVARNSLWYHEKKCNIENEENKFNIIDKDKLIIQLLKQNSELIKDNSEFKNIMIDVIKNGTHNTTNSNNTNSNNKTFNLNLFLNETCKDAMNITDFVDSIKLQLSDLENVGKMGYVEGLSNIIIKNLKDLDITERPIHCTDKKRDILYIKDENKWEKEDEDKKRIKKVIKKIASKNALLLPKFKEIHPDCVKSSSKFSDQYNKLIVESMGGSGDNDLEKENKIIKNVANQVIINKDKYSNII